MIQSCFCHSECGPPPCGFLLPGGGEFGDSATIECPDGYIPTDPLATVICLPGGIWETPTDTCEPVGTIKFMRFFLSPRQCV